MPQQKLKIAIAGLGRMGSRHATNFYSFTPRAEIIAVSSPMQSELTWATRNIEGARTYLDYDEMLRTEIKNGLQAVVIASVTTVHAEQAIKAIELGLHVLCEKPLSTNVEIVCFVLIFRGGISVSRCLSMFLALKNASHPFLFLDKLKPSLEIPP